ncbi:MAG: adenylyltransferase/cytidyltransferase family protein, partial [Kiritimatiellae bacterium]|nr:adenylyltransferase/cytidyltransferase family protein [Kiritimatiellia bacterium]
AMAAERKRLKKAGRALVFTNGAFDILHPGHVKYLDWARRQGDALCVGLNSDRSVRSYKDKNRPINPQVARARVLAALECVDYVVVFDEPEPAKLIELLVPDVLVKGRDWAHYVSGRETVENAGGRVALAKMEKGCSTSGIIEKILDAYRGFTAQHDT